MSDLGELLELLYDARHRYRTVRGLVVQRHSMRLRREAIKRVQARQRRRGGGSVSVRMMYAWGAGDEPEPPDLQVERTRFWSEPPDRLREEVESEEPHRERTTVIDGELWWTYTPEWGAVSNAALDEEERGRHGFGSGEQYRTLLDPSGLPAVLELGEIEADGGVLRVRARPRDDLDRMHGSFFVHLPHGADAFEIVVDRERGVVLRLTAYLDGEELDVTELAEVAFDEDFPSGTFVFVPPSGEEVQSPEVGRARVQSLEEAAAAVDFPIFAIPALPEGGWRMSVHARERRGRPPVPPFVTLLYHRDDGRESIVVSQRPAGDDRTSWPGLEPKLEEIERDGVRYTLCHGDPETGGQNAVGFEREGTAVQLQSNELTPERLLELAVSLEPL